MKTGTDRANRRSPWAPEEAFATSAGGLGRANQSMPARQAPSRRCRKGRQGTWDVIDCGGSDAWGQSLLALQASSSFVYLMAPALARHRAENRFVAMHHQFMGMSG